ncbi:DUF2029 domain-containing protein [Phycicoccus sp. CSK15P-2]|uniref:glycosyltransferase family 87 protein n=1 Tax=Phycicoccus sp. CSK15P-2 TaxID=2807627 RepID=UPI0019508FA0|nr:glycosyltransferase family 87 protein [Phycicoccus sp. CSK15P-2]MBM6405956.1 DUF2029 domain-containing protein [Phycicoccus sp. CSK15P-2]
MDDIGTDSAHAYWNAWNQDLYGAGPGSVDAYNYSPAFAQLLYPVTLLSWPVFLVVWSALLVTALVWLMWPLPHSWRWPVLLYVIPPAVAIGNIEPLLAVVAVLGFRCPCLWAFPLLTKVVPGVGVLWFVVRREWRHAAWAVGATLGVLTLSFVADPGLWFAWGQFLLASSDTHIRYLPLWIRLPVAVGLTVWGALRARPTTLAVAMMFAMPLWSSGVLLMLTAVPRLSRLRGPETASRPQR